MPILGFAWTSPPLTNCPHGGLAPAAAACLPACTSHSTPSHTRLALSRCCAGPEEGALSSSGQIQVSQKTREPRWGTGTHSSAHATHWNLSPPSHAVTSSTQRGANPTPHQRLPLLPNSTWPSWSLQQSSVYKYLFCAYHSQSRKQAAWNQLQDRKTKVASQGLGQWLALTRGLTEPLKTHKPSAGKVGQGISDQCRASLGLLGAVMK